MICIGREIQCLPYAGFLLLLPFFQKHFTPSFFSVPLFFLNRLVKCMYILLACPYFSFCLGYLQ